MNKTLLQLCTLMVSMLAASASFGQALEKPGGYACVPELCIGDGIEELKKIKFQPATIHRLDAYGEWSLSDTISKVPVLLDVKKRLPSEMQFQVDGQKYLAASARGDSKAIAAALPYVYYENFDGRGLEALAKIEAVCTINFSGYGLAARYIGANNRLTTVQIKMVPDEEGTGQAWRVVRIERYFPSPGQLTTEQRLEAVEKVKLLYPTTAWTGGVNSSNSNSLVFLEPVETHHRLNAFGKFNNRIESMDAYLAHPLCKAKGVSF